MSERRGVARGRARTVRLAGVAATARRRVVAADGRRHRRRRDRSVSRWPWRAASRPIPDAARRRAAYEGELAAWETVAVPLAAALNGAKGELAVLNRRRGFVDDLEPNLRANNVDRATLDAMTAAVVESLPDFRRYFRAKAPAARPRRRAAVVGSLRAGRRQVGGRVGHATAARARRVRRLLARSRRAREPRVRRAVGRRRDPRRQARRRVLRVGRR